MKWERAKCMLREGGKITRPRWEAEHFWVMSKDGFERILCHDGANASVHLEQTEATDWELWQEEKTLSDKVIFACQGCIGNLNSQTEGWNTKIILIGDVKESVKKLKKLFEKWEIDADVQAHELKRIFGDKLC